MTPILKMSNAGGMDATLNRYSDMLAGNAAYNPPSFYSIATVTAAGGETSLAFSSIPSTYNHLQLRGILKDSYVTGTGGENNCKLQFNSDTSSLYPTHQLKGDGTTASAGGSTGVSFIAYSIWEYFGNATNTFAVNIVDIIDYANTSKYKTVRSFGGEDINGTATGGIHLGSGYWPSTSAITSIQISGFLSGAAAGSTFALYGIK